MFGILNNDDDENGNKSVVKAEPEDTAFRLARLMQEFNVGCVVIADADEPVGIVTDRDLALAIGTSGFDPDELIAGDIMRSPIETIEAGSSFIETAVRMSEKQVRRMPVTKDGELVDIITLDDFVGLLSEVTNRLHDVIKAEEPVKIQDQ